MNNYQKIKNMSVKEMTELFKTTEDYSGQISCELCQFLNKESCTINGHHCPSAIEWLQQEAE